MYSRLMRGKVSYVEYILEKEDSLVGHVLTSLKENHKKDHWLIEIITFCRNTGLSEVNLKGTKNDKIKTIINNWDKELWK